MKILLTESFLTQTPAWSAGLKKISIGIPRSPIDFCNRSFLAGHPRSIAVHLSQQVQDALNANFFDEPHLVAKRRAVFFLPNGPSGRQSSEVVNPKFCSRVRNMSEKS